MHTHNIHVCMCTPHICIPRAWFPRATGAIATTTGLLQSIWPVQLNLHQWSLRSQEMLAHYEKVRERSEEISLLLTVLSTTPIPLFLCLTCTFFICPTVKNDDCIHIWSCTNSFLGTHEATIAFICRHVWQCKTNILTKTLLWLFS